MFLLKFTLFVVFFSVSTFAATPINPPKCHGSNSSSLTKATDKQRLSINQLIKKVTFASAAKNTEISTYDSYGGFRPAGDFAKFRIQSGKLTYGDVLIKIGKNFAVSTIRNAFIKSVYCAQIITLS